MTAVLLRLFVREYAGLAILAITVAICCGLLLQLFSTPDSVVLYSFSCGVIFGVFGGGFRRATDVLEFVLTRNVSRKKYYLLRWLVGLVPLVFSVAFVGINLFLPLSGWFWGFFVESGFTEMSVFELHEGLGWFLFSLFGAVWSYSVTYVLVSRTRTITAFFISLLLSLVITVGVILVFIAGASLFYSLELISSTDIYNPVSRVWIMYYGVSVLLSALCVNSGLRIFCREDLA